MAIVLSGPEPNRKPVGLFARNVYKGGRHFEDVKQLSDAVHQEFAKIDVIYVQNLIQGMRRRLLKVLEKKEDKSATTV